MTEFNLTSDQQAIVRMALAGRAKEMRDLAHEFAGQDLGEVYAAMADEAMTIFNVFVDADLLSIAKGLDALADAITSEETASTPREFWANPDAHADDPMPDWKADQAASDDMPHVMDLLKGNPWVKRQTGNGL